MAYEGREVFIVSNETKDGYVRGVVYVGTLKENGDIEFTTSNKTMVTVSRDEPTLQAIETSFNVTIPGMPGPYTQARLREIYLLQNPEVPQGVSDLRSLKRGGRSKRRRPPRKSKRKSR